MSLESWGEAHERLVAALLGFISSATALAVAVKKRKTLRTIVLEHLADEEKFQAEVKSHLCFLSKRLDDSITSRDKTLEEWHDRLVTLERKESGE